MFCKYCKIDRKEEDFEIANVIKEKPYRRKKCRYCRILQKKIRRKKHALWLKEYKSTLRCERCGFSDYRALEFHHKDRDNKSYQVSVMMTWCIEKIKEEIEKCIVLCANCHRIEHYQQLVDNWT